MAPYRKYVGEEGWVAESVCGAHEIFKAYIDGL